MAWDEGGEKSEKPTARRRSEAREQGRIARSTDLVAAISLLAALILLNKLGTGMIDQLLMLTRDAGAEPILRVGGLTPWILHCVDAMRIALTPFLVTLVIISLLVSFGQVGLYFSWNRLAPKFGGLNPVAGIQRLFSKSNAVKFVFSLLKMGLVAAVGWWTIRGQFAMVLGAGLGGPAGFLHTAASITYTLVLRMGIALLIIGILDYFWQRYSLERSLMMTKQEVKDEMKNMEGDPAIKLRIRRAQYKLAMQRLHTEVPKANVIVTNPTHYSVALQYDGATMAAPRVVAKGKDYLALRIRQIAAAHNVPIVERPALARSLYATAEIGQEIPPALYRAVAELLAYVYQLTGKALAMT